MRTTRTRRLAATTAVVAALFLGGCGGGEDDALPDIDTGQAQPQSSGASVVGLLVSADEKQVVLRMPDGTQRTFQVRQQDLPKIGLGHLRSHAGFTDVGFQVFYVTENGTDYVTGAFETAPPQLVPAGPQAPTANPS